MVLNALKSIIQGKSNGYPAEFNKIIEKLNLDPETDQGTFDFLWKAYEFGADAHKEQVRRSGKPYFTHCVAVGSILAEWNMDPDTIVGGLLHDTIEDTPVSRKDIVENFNEDVADLVEGVSKLSGIRKSKL